MPTRDRPRGTRYQQLASSLRAAIAQGIFPVGQRLPSVRELARTRGISITTAVNALRLLEQDGITSACPRSGHYVTRPPAAPAVPPPSRPPMVPTAVDGRRLALNLLHAGQDPGCIQLAAAVPAPDLLPLRELARLTTRLGRMPDAWSAYCPPPGLRELRAQVARRYLALECGFGPDDVVITDGASEAISLALRATCRPGDVVAIESPIFYGILQAIDALGLRVLELPTDPRDGLLLGTLREALDEHAVRAVVAVTNFNNPLGSRMPDEAKRELVELLAERDLPLIEDDIYGDLAHDGTRPSVAKRWDREGRVLLCSSLSKAVGPGLRVGWVAGGRWHDDIQALKACTTLASATLPQSIAASYLAGGAYERHLTRVRAACATRCAAMTAAVARSFPPGVRVTQPSGGYVLWVELPRTVDGSHLATLARRDRIAIAPGHLFSAKARYRHFIRLNAARWDADVDRAISHLGRLAVSLERSAARAGAARG